MAAHPSTPATERQVDLDEAWEAFFASLRRVRGRYARREDDDGTGLSLSQYVLLAPLADDVALPVGELAVQAGVAPPTATRSLDGLAARELIVRAADPDDRRCVVIRLTPEGRRALRRKRAAIRRKRAKLLADLDPVEREQARDLLLRLADLIDSV